MADPQSFNVQDVLTSRAMEYFGGNDVLANLEDPGPADEMTMALIDAIKGGSSVPEAFSSMFGPELQPSDESFLLSRLPGVYKGLEDSPDLMGGIRPGLKEYVMQIQGNPLRKYSLNQAGEQLLNRTLSGGEVFQPTPVPTPQPTPTPLSGPTGSIGGAIGAIQQKKQQEEELRRQLGG